MNATRRRGRATLQRLDTIHLHLATKFARTRRQRRRQHLLQKKASDSTLNLLPLVDIIIIRVILLNPSFAPNMCLFLGCISHPNMFNTAFQILYILHSASALYFFCHSILAVKCAISATSGNVVKGDLCDLPFFYNGVRYVHVGCARACVHTSYTHT